MMPQGGGATPAVPPNGGSATPVAPAVSAAMLIEALESGRYTKGESQLRFDNLLTGVQHWCCLGVFCDLAGLDYEPQWAYPTDSDGIGRARRIESAPWLTPALQEELAEINDHASATFAPVVAKLREIASATDPWCPIPDCTMPVDNGDCEAHA